MELTQQQRDKLWGDDGPYSQANLTIQARILDDKISRVFLIVEADINPFTYETVKEHRAQFADDLKISQLLDHAEYRGQEFGYVVSAFEAEYIDESIMKEAQDRLQYTIDTLIKMHKFVIDLYDIKR